MLVHFYLWHSVLQALFQSIAVINAEKVSQNKSSFIPILSDFTSSHSHTVRWHLGIVRNY